MCKRGSNPTATWGPKRNILPRATYRTRQPYSHWENEQGVFCKGISRRPRAELEAALLEVLLEKEEVLRGGEGDRDYGITSFLMYPPFPSPFFPIVFVRPPSGAGALGAAPDASALATPVSRRMVDCSFCNVCLLPPDDDGNVRDQTLEIRVGRLKTSVEKPTIAVKHPQHRSRACRPRAAAAPMFSVALGPSGPSPGLRNELVPFCPWAAVRWSLKRLAPFVLPFSALVFVSCVTTRASQYMFCPYGRSLQHVA